LYSLPNINKSIIIIRLSGHVARHERNAYRVSVRKPQGNVPLRSPRPTWDDNIKILLLLGWDGMEWIDMAQDSDQWRAPVNTVTNLRHP
jgi:hypothetical protein